MTATTLEQVTALPVSGNVDKAALRALLTRRTPLTLGATETLADFIVTDPASGVIPQFVIQNGTIYEYDSLDTTTVASAICLVSGDTTGLRYKTGGITAPYSVLTVGTTAQPASPSVDDRYLIPVAATGTDWAGKDGKVGIYSRAGWQFAIVPIGRGLYAEDTNIRWFRNAAGTWVSGFGAVTIGAGGINITNMLGAKASFVVKVENQTTATAPASPVAFVAYIVAGSGGAWSGYSVGDVAMCLADGVWTRIVPATGDRVYDKALGYQVEWKGAAWESAAGAIVGFAVPVITPGSGSTTNQSGTSYTYSATSLPTTSAQLLYDNATISYTAKRANSWLELDYQCVMTALFGGSPAAGDLISIAVFRGSGSTAIAQFPASYLTAGFPIPASVKLKFQSPDTALYAYKIAIVWASGGSVRPSTITSRVLNLKEYA